MAMHFSDLETWAEYRQAMALLVISVILRTRVACLVGFEGTESYRSLLHHQVDKTELHSKISSKFASASLQLLHCSRWGHKGAVPKEVEAEKTGLQFHSTTRAIN